MLLSKPLRQQALEIIHEGHVGVEKCKSLLR